MTFEEFKAKRAEISKELRETNEKAWQLKQKSWNLESELKYTTNKCAADLAKHKANEVVKVYKKGYCGVALEGEFCIRYVEGHYNELTDEFWYHYVASKKIKSGWSQKDYHFDEEHILDSVVDSEVS